MNQDLTFYHWFLRRLQVTSVITCVFIGLCYRYSHHPLTFYGLRLSFFFAILCLAGWSIILGVRWGKYLMLDDVHHLDKKLETQFDSAKTLEHNLSLREKKIKELKDDLTALRIENINLRELNQRIARTPAQANKNALQKLVGGQR